MIERGGDLLLQVRRIGFSILIVMGADSRRNGETRRHREPEIGHLGEAGALAAEKVAHLRTPFSRSIPEAVHPFGVAFALWARASR